MRDDSWCETDNATPEEVAGDPASRAELVNVLSNVVHGLDNDGSVLLRDVIAMRDILLRERKDGGLAFASYGMSLRDYFAAKAMQGLLSLELELPETIAENAYAYADAMLAEREKGE